MWPGSLRESGYLLVPPSLIPNLKLPGHAKTRGGKRMKTLKKNLPSVALLAAGVMVVAAVAGFGVLRPSVEAEFSLRNLETSGDGFIMSIGEETLLEWNVSPPVEGVKLELPKGLEHLGGELEYKRGNTGVRIRAVKVGKWPLVISSERADYEPNREYFVCIGIMDEDARKYCE